MRSPGHSALGVDIAPDEVRIVELSGRWPDVHVARAGAVALRPGAVEGGRIDDPDAVAAAIRSLVAKLNTGTREAVLGIADRGVLARMLEVPRVPDSELRTIVRGELEHYQVLRAGAGSFDLLRLAADGEGDSRQALVMAADDAVVNGYQMAAERAGLRLAALEPVPLALLRVSLGQWQAAPATLCLSVSYGRSEIIFLQSGQMRLFRRLDIGTDELVCGRRARHKGGPTDLGGKEEKVLLGQDEEPEELEVSLETTDDSGPLVASAANALAIEVQRSIEYFRREFPQAKELSRCLLQTNDPEAEPLAEWLSEALHIDLTVAPLPPALEHVAEAIAPPAGLRYGAATGLAMRELQGLPPGLPRFDLSTIERVAPDVQIARGKVAAALVLSVLFVVGGGIGAYRLGGMATDAENGLAGRRAHLAQIQAQASARTDEIARQENMMHALTGDIYSTPRLMDMIAGAVDPGVGLTDFSLDKSGKVSMSGDAEGLQSFNNTLRNLQNVRELTNVRMENLDNSGAAKGDGSPARFQVTAQVIGMGAQGGGK